jgi:hypothetical protein
VNRVSWGGWPGVGLVGNAWDGKSGPIYWYARHHHRALPGLWQIGATGTDRGGPAVVDDFGNLVRV